MFILSQENLLPDGLLFTMLKFLMTFFLSTFNEEPVLTYRN